MPHHSKFPPSLREWGALGYDIPLSPHYQAPHASWWDALSVQPLLDLALGQVWLHLVEASAIHWQDQTSHQLPTGTLPICANGVPLQGGSPPVFPCQLPWFTFPWTHWAQILWSGLLGDCSVPVMLPHCSLGAQSLPYCLASPAGRRSSSISGVLTGRRGSPTAPGILAMMKAAVSPPAGCLPASKRMSSACSWSPAVGRVPSPSPGAQLFPRHSSSMAKPISHVPSLCSPCLCSWHAFGLPSRGSGSIVCVLPVSWASQLRCSLAAHATVGR